MDLYENGAGSDYSFGTLYGILQAVTDLGSNGTGKRDPSHQFWNSSFGKSDKIKTEVFQDMIEFIL
jgi:hypothetical protein